MAIHRMTSRILAFALSCTLVGCAGGQDSAVSIPEVPTASTSQAAEPEVTSIPFTLAYYPNYSIHPTLAENRANLTLAPLLYESLFTVDASFQAVPELCESYTTSEDGLTWTFTLRSGIVFSDGTPLTGTIAASALNTALGSGSRYAGRISGLNSITGSDQNVTISLTRPNGNLPVLLDIPISLGSGEIPLGTGPYVLTQVDNTPQLSARTDWWQQKSIPFQTIRLSGIQQADDLIAAFDSGAVTLLDADLTATNALGYSGSYEAWDYNTTTLIYLGFNTTKGYCKDASVRQALSMGIDRESIATIPYARHAVASSLPIHPASPLFNVTLAEQTDYDPDALVEALNALPQQQRPLKLVVNSENNAKASTAEYIAYQLGAAGISVEVEKLPWDNYLTTLANGSFDLYLAEVMLTADFDLSALLSSSGTLNYGRWSNEQTDTLLSGLCAASDSQRTQSATLLLAHLNAQVPIAPVCFKHGSVLTQWGRLTGLSPVQNNVFYGLASWALEH